jgi:hypothetical protein
MIEGKYIALMAIASCGAGAVIVKSIADAVVQYAKLKREKVSSGREREFDERLSRLENAIDAVSIEVERVGELHRFSAQLAMGRTPSEGMPAELKLSPPSATGRVITPH